MSYANARVPLRARLASGAAVVAIHAGIGAVLVIGLAFTGVIEKPEILDAYDLPSPVPTEEPPPPQQPREELPSPPIDAPTPPIAIPQPDRYEVPDRPTPRIDDTVFTPTPVPTFTPAPVPTFSPTPTPAPSFTPKAAAPRGNPGGWATTNDYPTSSLRREEEGLTGFRVTVGTNGRVSACEITRSSGSSALDDTTCRLISSRARFDAATGSDGEKVVGSYSGSIRWQLPD